MNKSLGKSILVIDDEQQILDLIEKFLKPHFQRVDRCSKASEARIKMTGVRYDFIILDVNLGRENGGELVAFLRDTETPNKNTPILFISAFFNEDFQLRNLERIEMMDKPFTKRKLIEKLEEMKRPLMTKEQQEGERNVELDDTLKAILSKKDS